MDISLDDIISALNRTTIVVEPEISFPQANSFKRVVNLCELLCQNDMTRDDITTNYDFDPRQTNYYTDAVRYLELVDKRRENGSVVFFLTSEGKNLFKLRQLKFVEFILRHKPFNKTFRKCLKSGDVPLKDEIVTIMENLEVYRVESQKAYQRRASTISDWINWILDLQR